MILGGGSSCGSVMMNAAEQLKPLGTDINPFNGPGARTAGKPVHRALGEVLRQIERKCPIVVVAGKAGTGKTLLVDLIARACSRWGFQRVRSIAAI